MNLPVTNLKSNLSKINARTNQWKIIFKPNPAKQFIFYSKIKKTFHPPLNFNNNPVKQVLFQKHLRVYLDGKLNFREHLQNIFKRNIVYRNTMLERN